MSRSGVQKDPPKNTKLKQEVAKRTKMQNFEKKYIKFK